MEGKDCALLTSSSLPSMLVDVKIIEIEINSNLYNIPKKKGDLFSTILEDKILKHSPNLGPLEINSYWNRCGSKMWFKEALIVQFWCSSQWVILQLASQGKGSSSGCNWSVYSQLMINFMWCMFVNFCSQSLEK
jgi:hypothetical protein